MIFKTHRRLATMLKTVIRMQTDMVAAFDENGRPLPEYQGWYEDVKEQILRDAGQNTVFKHWHENAREPETVARNNW